jgi:hypothetical protein
LKTFTLEEAQAVLPVVQALLKRALAARESAVEIEDELQQLKQRIFVSGGMRVDVLSVVRRRDALALYEQQVEETVAEINSIGVEVKDLDAGLLDFPCMLDSEVVLLCWKQGESRITHWHTQQDGFRGRKPIDERFQRSRPN